MPHSAFTRTSRERARLLVILALLLGVGFAATSLISYWVSRDSIRDSIVATELPLTSDNVYSEIQKDLVRPILISSMMARDTFVRDWVLKGERDVEAMTRYLKEIMSHYGAFTSFFVSDASRTYYHADGVLKRVEPNEARDAWYFRVRGMQELHEINVDPDLANRDKLTIFINYRVLDYQGRFIGATGVGLTVDAVLNLINTYQQRYERSIFFADHAGRIVLAGQGNDVLASARTLAEIDGLAGQAEAILKAGKGSFSYDAGGQRHYVNVRYIPELKWYLFVAKTDDKALSEVRRTLYLNLALCAAVTLLVLGIVYLAIRRYQRRLEEMATTDHLTGLANRHALQLLLRQSIRDAERNRTPLAVLMIDIDHFKEANDTHGHLVGDQILVTLAQRLRAHRRASDIVCRWGGEEFLIVLNRTDEDAAERIADEIRLSVADEEIATEQGALRLTISAGVASFCAGDNDTGLIRRADAALFEAKKGGRNRICVAAPASGVARIDAHAD